MARRGGVNNDGSGGGVGWKCGDLLDDENEIEILEDTKTLYI